MIWYRLLWTHFFQTWSDGRHDKTLNFDTNVNDIDLQSRPQDLEKFRTCAVIPLKSGIKKPQHSQWSVMWGRWLLRNLVSMASIDRMSILLLACLLFWNFVVMLLICYQYTSSLSQIVPCVWERESRVGGCIAVVALVTAVASVVVALYLFVFISLGGGGGGGGCCFSFSDAIFFV